MLPAFLTSLLVKKQTLVDDTTMAYWRVYMVVCLDNTLFQFSITHNHRMISVQSYNTANVLTHVCEFIALLYPTIHRCDITYIRS